MRVACYNSRSKGIATNSLVYTEYSNEVLSYIVLHKDLLKESNPKMMIRQVDKEEVRIALEVLDRTVDVHKRVQYVLMLYRTWDPTLVEMWRILA